MGISFEPVQVSSQPAPESSTNDKNQHMPDLQSELIKRMGPCPFSHSAVGYKLHPHKGRIYGECFGRILVRRV